MRAQHQICVDQRQVAVRLTAPRSTFGAADFNRSRYTIKAAFAELRQEVGDDWVVRLSGQYGKSFTSLFSSYAFSFTGLTPEDGSAFLLASALTRDQDYLTGDLNAVGTVSLFGREHEVIIGTDYQRKSRFETFSDRAFLGTFNLYDPDYDAYPKPDLPATFIADTATKQFGIYGQTRLSLAEPLKLVLGGRLSWYEQDVETVLPTAPTTHYRKNGRFTPYAGLVFDVTPSFTAYASYANTFTPQTGVSLTGDVPKPATGKQFEIGIKQELFDDRLLLSFAVFQIEQTGLAQADPLNPGFVLSSGKIRSRGFELEANGQIAPGWTVNGGYSFNRLRYVNDTQNLAAANERQQPRHSVKLWTMYRPEEGALADWSIGGGLTWQSRIAAELTQIGFGGEARQKGYVLVDARIGHQVTDAIEIAATVNNLFDKKYYERVNGIQFGNFYGAPRNLLVTARVKL